MGLRGSEMGLSWSEISNLFSLFIDFEDPKPQKSHLDMLVELIHKNNHAETVNFSRGLGRGLGGQTHESN